MSVGLDQVFLCSGSDVCDVSGACVAPQCSVAGDCPVGDDCINELCQPGSDGDPPTALSYTTIFAVYTETIPIASNTPSSSGGPVVSYAVSPALPVGLTMDPSTGIITGTPSLETTLAEYKVTATNSEGSTSATLSFGVNSRGALTCGTDYACARVNGGVQCWGGNLKGNFGNDSTTSSSVPVTVSALTTGVMQIDAGGFTTCALVDGGVQCWGFNSNGQLGNNSTTDSNVPVEVPALTSGVAAIAEGGGHTCALVGGGVQCWGQNTYGQLGNNTTTNSSVPVAVSGLTSGVQAIAAGGDYTCALLTTGGVECWGANSEGELGTSNTTESHVPVPVTGLPGGAQAIVTGAFTTCALVNGGVLCWGANESGEVGDNSTQSRLVPVAVSGLTSGVQQLSAGQQYMCALVEDGAQCWGLNDSGQLGNNSTGTNSPVPVNVSGLSSGVQEIAAGNDATCALVNGGVMCWGGNTFGDLGNNSSTASGIPVAVSGLTSGVQP